MKYHLIGDQGVSMRGIKEYLSFLGHTVTGSDLKTGGHKKENITADLDAVIRTSAANNHSEAKIEIDEAEKLGIKIMKRSEILKEITEGKQLIAISGMHGKTTVTTMAGLVLAAAGFDPTIFVGADVKEINGVVRIGRSDWFVMEACEYDRAFLDFYPKILILTNIEEEHLDTYPGGLPEIKKAFLQYVNHLPDDGLIIASGDDQNIREVMAERSTKAKVVYYGKGSTQYNSLEFELAIPGQHNIQNALSVLALADYLGIDDKIVEDVLSTFQNADRRFEKRGVYNGADLIDDYGHHPTEIKTTIEALCERYPDKKKYVVFWPHQYKRILPLIDKFASSFKGADQVIIKPIYFVPGRDEVLPVSSEQLVGEINKVSGNALFLATDQEIAEYLKHNLDHNSVLLTIGIPPVYKVIDKILEKK
ncbi:MAG: Mur ligase family protein [Patescibacteria group bacterium]